MAKAQIEIGKRASEEVFRLFEKSKDAQRAICGNNNGLIYHWQEGVAPSIMGQAHLDHPLIRCHNAAAEQIVGADRCDQNAVGLRLNNRTTGRKTIGR